VATQEEKDYGKGVNDYRNGDFLNEMAEAVYRSLVEHPTDKQEIDRRRGYDDAVTGKAK